jgi:hypothetical protein
MARRRWLPALVAGIAVAATGVVHGVWTGRWDEVSAAPAYGPALEQIPMQLGEWLGQGLELDPREAANYSAVLYRRYVHQRTGAVVTVVLVAGRPGPVSIHSPDYCYPASGYDTAAWTVHKIGFDNAHAPAEFKTALVSKTQVTGLTHMRVLWSWYAAGSWSVPDNPRLAFASQHSLHKLHVVREASPSELELENDAAVDLVREFLVAFQRQAGVME